jgi:putative transposase
MPRRARYCPAGLPVHIIQRGNNRQTIFTSDDDLAAYAHWLAEGARRFDVAIHGWVFMTNHVHLLATPAHVGNTSQLMQYLGRYYVRHFNYTYARSGTLFEGRFKSSIVQEDHYFLTCLRYIELNPVRAGLVKDPGDYRWSSYRAHAFEVNVGLWTPHSRYLDKATTPRSASTIPKDLSFDIEAHNFQIKFLDIEILDFDVRASFLDRNAFSVASDLYLIVAQKPAVSFKVFGFRII